MIRIKKKAPRPKLKPKDILVYLVLIFFSAISLFPLYWMISAATNNSTDVLGGKLAFGNELVNNFHHLVEAQNLWGCMKNSFFYATILTIFALLVCSIAGYGFEIYHTKGKDRVMSILLLAMMVPFIVIMIPLFKTFTRIGIQSTWIAYILPTVSTPFLIMLFRQSTRNFPIDIIEAGRLEGLSEIGIFFKMYMPTMKSTYAAAMTVTFMNAWNNYLWPKVIMMDDSSQTMPMLVANLSVGYSIDYGMLMLSVLFCSLPTGILFLILQKSFSNGLTGSVKM